jgi:hypothetical protein
MFATHWMRTGSAVAVAFWLAWPGAVLGRETPPAGDATSTEAEADDRIEVWLDRRLKGHDFLPSDFVTDPFVTTHFDSSTGFGWVRAKASGPGGSLQADLAEIVQRIELQAGVVRVRGVPWLGLRFIAAGHAATGLDANAFQILPTTLGYEFGGGLAVRLWGNDWVQLGIKTDVTWAKDWALTPLRAIENSVNAGTITLDGLLTATSELRFLPSFQVAFSPHRVFGLWTSLQYGFAHPAAGDDSHLLRFGLAAGLDFDRVSPVPLGLLFTYTLDQTLPDDGRIHYVGGGLFYTGRRDLALGLEVRGTWQSISDAATGTTVDLTSVQGGFRIRYYW